MRFIILTLTIFFHCTKDKDSENCINESKISDMVCIEIGYGSHVFEIVNSSRWTSTARDDALQPTATVPARSI